MSANRSAPATHDFAPSWLRIPQSENASSVLQASSLSWQRTNNGGGRPFGSPSASTSDSPAAVASAYVSSTRRVPILRRDSAPAKPSAGQQIKASAKEPHRNTGGLKEEDFPRLSDDKLASSSNGCQGPWGRSSHQKNAVAGSADQRCTSDAAESTSLQLGNAPGKVYRAQINKGMVSRRQHSTLSQPNGVLLDNQQFDHKQTSDPVDIPNGRLASGSSASSDMPGPLEVADYPAPLSSSLEKEQRLLREMGWREDDYENCEISEAECQGLQSLLIKAKAERERLRLRCLPSLSKLQLASSSSNNTSATPSSALSPSSGSYGLQSLPSEAEALAFRAGTGKQSLPGCAADLHDSQEELASSSSGNSDTE